MPRIAAALGVAVTIAACIGFNTVRYPIVWEMLAGPGHLPPAAAPATGGPEDGTDRRSSPAPAASLAVSAAILGSSDAEGSDPAESVHGGPAWNEDPRSRAPGNDLGPSLGENEADWPSRAASPPSWGDEPSADATPRATPPEEVGIPAAGRRTSPSNWTGAEATDLPGPGPPADSLVPVQAAPGVARVGKRVAEAPPGTAHDRASHRMGGRSIHRVPSVEGPLAWPGGRPFPEPLGESIPIYPATDH